MHARFGDDVSTLCVCWTHDSLLCSSVILALKETYGCTQHVTTPSRPPLSTLRNCLRLQHYQPQFLTEFTMSFDDDSRIVVKEGMPPPPAPSSRPASSSKREARKSTTTNTARSHGGGGKPDGFGTVTCVQTFPTGLVVSTGSDGTVSRGGQGKGGKERERALFSRFSCFIVPVLFVRRGAYCCSNLTIVSLQQRSCLWDTNAQRHQLCFSFLDESRIKILA